MAIPGAIYKGFMNDVTQKFDFGVYIGGGLAYSISEVEIFLEGKYRFGLNNLQKGGNIQVSEGTSSFNFDLEVEVDNFFTRGFAIMAG